MKRILTLILCLGLASTMAVQAKNDKGGKGRGHAKAAHVARQGGHGAKHQARPARQGQVARSQPRAAKRQARVARQQARPRANRQSRHVAKQQAHVARQQRRVGNQQRNVAQRQARVANRQARGARQSANLQRRANRSVARSEAATRNLANANRQQRANRNRVIERRGPSNYAWSYDEARRRHDRHARHDRSWYRNNYSRFALFAGGYYYWDRGYWYPAYGYDPSYSVYIYDEPIYGYNDLDPSQVIVNVQLQLQAAGYYHGAIDGLIGPMTRSALARYQIDTGLYVSRAIDGPTLASLGLT